MTLKRTPLYDNHVAAGATMVDFGGFEMPLKYTSETAEHMAVRAGVGVFDVSHMGEVFMEGKGALAAIQRLVTNDAALIKDGQAMYAGLLNEKGGFVDDVIVYRFSPERFLVCVNAGNQDKDFNWMRAVVAASGFACKVTNQGSQWSQLAVQGPKAVDVVAKLCGEGVRAIQGYHFIEGPIGIIARTGYTGEDGFELYVKNAQAPALWDAIVAAGAVPCGLACRDTLRLEAGMCLYGNDIDEDVTPLEANLGWILKFSAPGSSAGGERVPFIGQEALLAQKAGGLQRVLRGLTMVDRGIARHGYDVVDAQGQKIGVVTSGTQAPFVNKPIAFAYLDRAHADVGATVFVSIRAKAVKATVEKLPFYKRSKPV